MNFLFLLSTLQRLLAEIISALFPPHPPTRPSDKVPSAESRESDAAAAEASARRMDAPLRKDHSTPSLHDFQRLPHHIQAYVITMACWLPAGHAQEPQRKGRPVVQLDAKTAKSLALVSKGISATASTDLYKNIHVARPSTLRLLVTAVVGRPALGRSIRALHIGPDAALPSDWLPIHQLKMVITMSAPSDQGQYPAWIHTPHTIPLNRRRDMEGPYSDVESLKEAMLQACQKVDIHLGHEGRCRLGATISKNDWYTRLFLFHAATELFVLELRRQEIIPTLYLPRLHLTGPPFSSTIKPRTSEYGPILNLTMEDLCARLAAPGSATDRFDHPLLFARSDVAWEARGPDGEMRRGGDIRKRRANALEDDCSIVPYTKEPPTSSVANLKGVLGLAGTLLSHTTRPRDLSLTGFLERAVCGGYASKSLETLRSLSIGPPPARWSWLNALHLDKVARGDLQRLRLCGHELRRDQATAMVGVETMPKLRELRWTHADLIADTSRDKAAHLYDLIDILTGRNFPPDSKSSSRKRIQRAKKSKEEDVDEELDPLLIEARLHPRDVTRILSMAPDEATRAAWMDGSTPPAAAKCRRCLCVRATGAVSDGDGAEDDLDRMYEEGSEWFELGVERTGRAS